MENKKFIEESLVIEKIKNKYNYDPAKDIEDTFNKYFPKKQNIAKIPEIIEITIELDSNIKAE